MLYACDCFLFANLIKKDGYFLYLYRFLGFSDNRRNNIADPGFF